MTTRRISGRTPWWKANSVEQRISDRQAFRTGGSLRGGYLYLTMGYRGELPHEWVDRLSEDLRDNDEYRGRDLVSRPAYVVWSYDTPIAWWTDVHGWRVPEVKYSRTTSRHQSRVSLAAAISSGKYPRPTDWPKVSDD